MPIKGQPQPADIGPEQDLADADGDERSAEDPVGGGRLRGANPVSVAPPQVRAENPPAVQRRPWTAG
jgi:hypothetical protein